MLLNRSIHDVKATDLGIEIMESCIEITEPLSHAGADIVQFKAEVNFDGREVARIHVSKLNLEELLKVSQDDDPDSHVG